MVFTVVLIQLVLYLTKSWFIIITFGKTKKKREKSNVYKSKTLSRQTYKNYNSHGAIQLGHISNYGKSLAIITDFKMGFNMEGIRTTLPAKLVSYSFISGRKKRSNIIVCNPSTFIQSFELVMNSLVR